MIHWMFEGVNIWTKATMANFTPIILGSLLPMIIPVLHFGVVSRLWDEYNYYVDKDECRNNCWDTIFKGKRLVF